MNLDAWFEKADAARWALTREEFQHALVASVRKSFPNGEPHHADMERHLSALHIADLALATACAFGRPAAWDYFVLTYRPVLYRSADALNPSGSAREIADALYADLYGLDDEAGARRSLFRYFHGRSSLATWLRAVLAQRFVDSLRAQRRTEPLDEKHHAVADVAEAAVDPDRDRLLPLVERALRRAIERLASKDRLRLRSYYVSQLTLAEIGRITGEHEATVSRQLARTRRGLRDEVESHLRDQHGLSREQVSRALELAIEDAGSLALQHMFDGDRKDSSQDRSRDKG